uniref:ZP domain-containing protein n=1 Tax=Oryzias latipes TaxID=8090 RepID=A0A3B3IN35_ORYLA
LLCVSIFSDAFIKLPITENSQVNTSSCPITYYGQEYTTIYINFTGEHMFVCFNGYYNPESNGDCIKAPNTENKTTFELNDDNNPSYWTYATTLVQSSVNTITNNATCYLAFYGSVSIHQWLQNLRLVNDSLVLVLFDDTAQSVCLNWWICLLHFSGFGVKPGTTRQSLDNCTSLICSNTRVSFTSRCDSLSNVTATNRLCTVTGPTVIDFRGQMNSVSDRCEYTLLQDQSTGFSLKANFLERRRRDVSFVDSVTLDFSQGADIQLLQGHRVLVSSPVTLSGLVQTFNGVGLSKDQTGVTADFSLNGSPVSLFFDGTTAQIYIGVPVNVKGLCADSSSSSSSRLSSDSTCQLYNDAADDTINPTTVAQQCNILKSSPFSSCNAVVDPESYIIACRNTLNKYPAVDGLRCQFLKAYAKACQKRQATVQNWWTAAKYHPEPICQDKCSDHEFCGDIHGNTDCRCRAIYASQYTEQNRLGGPTVCKDNTASLTLVGCLLKENGIDYNHLHLNDKTCTGVMDPESHMLKFSFSSDSCGTEVTTNNSQVIFTNAVVTRNSSSDLITRQDKVFIEFSCSHPAPELQNVAFKIIDNWIMIFLQSGEWHYNLTMKAYSDAAQTQLLGPNSDVRLNQKIWIVLETNGLDEEVVSVVTDSCWATSGNSPSSSPRYDLITDGCANAADGTVQVMGNGQGTSNSFSFNMFEFSGKEPSEVYLHCQLQLCVNKNNICEPGCSGPARRRRSLRYRRGTPALISMVWTP